MNKKWLWIAGSIALLVPVIFKDDIQKQVSLALHKNLEADVYFDPSKFGLTLFRNFPKLELPDYTILKFQTTTIYLLFSL